MSRYSTETFPKGRAAGHRPAPMRSGEGRGAVPPRCSTLRRLLLADAQELFVAGLGALLERTERHQVVATASTGYEVIERARSAALDLVIMDVSMPQLSGIETARRLSAELDRIRILFLASSGDERLVAAAFDAGASGYLLKDCSFEELSRALDVVASDRFHLSPGIAAVAVDALRRRSAPRESAFSLLSDREREVLQLLAEGYSTKSAAERLCLSAKTVHSHRHRLMDKLQIGSTAGLVKYAIRQGLTSDEPDRRPASPHRLAVQNF